MIQDIYSRKLWAKATEEKGSDDYIEVLESLFADTGKPTEINADGEFDNRTFNRFLSRRGISVRYKQGRNDLATLDAAMNNFKKMLKKQMQEKNTKEWEPLVQKVVKAHNNLSHEALMAGADPNDAYDESNKALQFELREEAGRTMLIKMQSWRGIKGTCRTMGHFGPTLDEKTLEEEATGHNTAER